MAFRRNKDLFGITAIAGLSGLAGYVYSQRNTAKDATEEENETGEEDTFLASKLKTPYGLLVIDGKPTENKDDNSKHVEVVIGSVDEKDVATAKDSPKEAKIGAGDEKGGESDSSGVKVEDLKKIIWCWYPSNP